MMRFEGKVAIVTGAAQGIGAAIAKRLYDEGAEYVALIDLSEDKVKAEAAKLDPTGVRAGGYACNVGSFEEVKSAFGEIEQAHGKIDILVNNAGITRDGLTLQMKEEDFDAVLDTNLKGAFCCCKAVYRPMMRQRSGRIINMSSIVGLRGNPGQANYCASKAGLIGLTKSLAKELAARKVTVNAVAPGFIDTDMTAVLSEQAKEAMLSTIPMAKLGQPEDVAHAVAFFASDEAAYITGQVLCVDGGMAV